jgi:hypothetical protein
VKLFEDVEVRLHTLTSVHTLWSFITRVRALVPQWVRGWVDSRASLDSAAKKRILLMLKVEALSFLSAVGNLRSAVIRDLNLTQSANVVFLSSIDETEAV